MIATLSTYLLVFVQFFTILQFFSVAVQFSLQIHTIFINSLIFIISENISTKTVVSDKQAVKHWYSRDTTGLQILCLCFNPSSLRLIASQAAVQDKSTCHRLAV